MGKDRYDDMTDRPSRKRRDYPDGKPSKGILWTVGLGLAICVVVVIVWYQVSPNEDVETGRQAVPVASAPKSPVVPSTITDVIAEAPEVTLPEEGVEGPTGTPVVVPTEPETPLAPEPDDANRARSLDDTALPADSSARIQYERHVVAEGEDLSSIASLYHLKTQTLISVNQIRNIQAIGEGTVLRIPDRDGQLYTVREGDMLSTIARKYNANLGWKTLQELNGLTSDVITVGQQLFIPDPVSQTYSANAEVAIVQFQKPTDGTITVLFGQPMENPTTGAIESSTGILMEGKPGTAVVAAASGKIVDAGYETKGKGRFVVISHESGYRTTYEHLEAVDETVRMGGEVVRGQVLGSIGTSGTNYKNPSLFFSIEQAGIALDPLQFI